MQPNQFNGLGTSGPIHIKIGRVLLKKAKVARKSAPPPDPWSFDSLLPGQFSRYSEDLDCTASWETRLAWKFLVLLANDCSGSGAMKVEVLSGKGQGKPIPRAQKQLAYIDECRKWIQNDATEAKFNGGENGFEFRFETWAEFLGQDADAFRDAWLKKLDEWEAEARARDARPSSL